MGRRKIEIQPITHERNRSVTFLKRKNGLFKKAYELGVLCSVDVAVIIFEKRPGHQPKLYEYCSSNVKDIVSRHIRHDGESDSRGPKDFAGTGAGKAAVDEDDEDDEMPPEEDAQAPPPPSSSRASIKRKNSTRPLKPEAANDESPSPDISVPTPPPLNELPILPGSSGLRPPTPPSIPVSSIRHNAPSTPSTRDTKRQRLHSPPPTRSSSAASGARAPTVPSHRPSFYPPLYDGPGSSFYPPGHPQSQQFGFGGGGMGGPGPYRGGIPPGYAMPLRGASAEAFPQFSSGFFESDGRQGGSGAFDWPVHERQPQPSTGAGTWFEMLGSTAAPPRSGNGHGTSWERGGPMNGTNGMADLLGVDQVDRG